MSGEGLPIERGFIEVGLEGDLVHQLQDHASQLRSGQKRSVYSEGSTWLLFIGVKQFLGGATDIFFGGRQLLIAEFGTTHVIIILVAA